MISFWEQHEHILDIVNICVGAFIAIVTVFGNFLTIIAIWRFKHLQTKSNILIFSLSCSDVLCVVCWMILEVIHVTLKPCKTDPNNYVWPHLTNAIFFTVSVLHLVVIGFERYIAIFHGLYYNKLINKKRFRIIIASCWVLPIILDFSIAPWISNWNKENHACSYGDIWTRLNVYIHSLLYLTCWPMVLYLYFRIYKAAKNHIKQIQALQVGCEEDGKKVNLRATKTLSLLLAAFFISWTPYFINNLVKYFTNPMDISLYVILYHVTFKIALMNSAVNFFIYAYNKKDFKAAYKQLLKGCTSKPTEAW